MKKVIFAIALMGSVSLVSCTGGAEEASASQVDSTAVLTSSVATNLDSLAVDSIKVDTTVVKK